MDTICVCDNKNVFYLKEYREKVKPRYKKMPSNYSICLTTAKVDNQVQRSLLHPLDGLTQCFVSHLGYCSADTDEDDPVTGRQCYIQANGFPKYKKKNLRREARPELYTAYLYSI